MKFSSAITSLFNVMSNYKLLLLLPPYIIDKCLIIIKHIVAQPAKVL